MQANLQNYILCFVKLIATIYCFSVGIGKDESVLVVGVDIKMLT